MAKRECPTCGRGYCYAMTEDDERERLIRVANADAHWWEMQINMLHAFPSLAAFAKEQAQRFREIAASLTGKE
jgi:hypothetical protein